MSNRRIVKCICNCSINGGMCDTQHRCGSCKGFLHAICGHEYFDDDGNVVEDLSYPRICNKCHESKKKTPKKRGAKASNKEKPKKQKTQPPNKPSPKKKTPEKDSETNKDEEDEDENTDSELESDDYNEDDEVFTVRELIKHSPGFLLIKDLK